MTRRRRHPSRPDILRICGDHIENDDMLSVHVLFPIVGKLFTHMPGKMWKIFNIRRWKQGKALSNMGKSHVLFPFCAAGDAIYLLIRL